MAETISTTYDQILQVATSHFAENGYHGSSIRDIAREVGVSVSTLYYHVQSKANLYRLVFQLQFQKEDQIISDIIAAAAQDVVQKPVALRDLLIQVADALIDRSIQNPDIVRLWARRWLEKPQETDGIEAYYSISLYDTIADSLTQAQAAGTLNPDYANFDLIIHSFTWLQYGFFGFGQLSYRSRIGDPFDPEQIEDFRAFIRAYVDKMLNFAE